MMRSDMWLVVILIALALLWLLQRFIVRHGRELWRVTVSLGRSIKDVLGRNPYVHRWVRRHPAGIRFLARRVDRLHFRGLPLTVLALVFAYVLALFAGIVEDVVTSDPIIAIDHATAQLIAVFRDSAVIPAFVWITNLGSPPLIGALLAVACVVLWLVNRRFASAGLLMSILGAWILLFLGKLVFRRPRPVEAVIFDSSYSFPSGHATEAIAFYGFLGYLLIRSATSWHLRVKLFFVTSGLVLLIGASRIVLGVHYLSDVWAGYLVGMLWLIAGISLNEWLTAGGRIMWHLRSDRRRRMAAFGLVSIASVGVIGYISSHRLPVQIIPVEPTVQVDRPFADILRAGKLSRTTTLLGVPEQPLAFAIVAPDENVLIDRLTRAGWMTADRPDLRNMLRLSREGMNYATAPLAPAFWNGRVNDLAFERSFQGMQGKALTTVRLWHTSFRVGQDRIFVGVAREYNGIRWGLMHTVSPDVDAATKGFIESIEALEALGLPAALCQQHLVPPAIGTYLMGERFFTRGQIWLLDLNKATNAARLCETGTQTR